MVAAVLETVAMVAVVLETVAMVAVVLETVAVVAVAVEIGDVKTVAVKTVAAMVAPWQLLPDHTQDPLAGQHPLYHSARLYPPNTH